MIQNILIIVINIFIIGKTFAINIESYNKVDCVNNALCKNNLVATFYKSNNYSPIWIKNNHLTIKAYQLINAINRAYQEGLNPDDYSVDKEIINKIQHNNAQVNYTIINEVELSLTNVFFKYATDLAYGNINWQKLYPEWQIIKRKFNLVEFLQTIINHNEDIRKDLQRLDPQTYQYIKLKYNLEMYQEIAAKDKWDTIPAGKYLKYGDTGNRVKLLQNRLLITGELENINNKHFGLFDKKLKIAVIRFQKSHHLTVTGIVNKTTLNALNIPPIDIIRNIEINMDRMRIMPNLNNHYVYINIPDYSLYIIDNHKNLLSMPVVVGNTNHQSCVVTSKIHYIEFNPYWYVPKGITKELVEDIKADPMIIKSNKLRIFKDLNQESTEINPQKIKWSDVDPDKFKYKFRQDPGANNALGIIKIAFANHCNMFLHYTLSTDTFNNRIRALSHGCIRIKKPIELSAYLLHNKSLNETDIKKIIDNKKTKLIYLNEPINIYIVYFTNWVDDNGILQFRNDIYGIDKTIDFTTSL